MSNYKHLYQAGGCYFFTLVTHQRKPILNSDVEMNILRLAFRKTMQKRPFVIKAIVVLPDHLHCIWQLPDGDDDFSTRWKIIKSTFTKIYKQTYSGNHKLWQPRFWGHLIRDERDLNNHLDYIHYNPVKHGVANSPMNWPYGSFHQFLKKGVYTKEWGNTGLVKIADLNCGEP